MSAKTVVRRFVIRDRRLPEPVTPVSVSVPVNAPATVVPLAAGGETHIAVSVGRAELRGVSTVTDGRERLRAAMLIPWLLAEAGSLVRELRDRGLLSPADELQDTVSLAQLVLSFETAESSSADLGEVAAALTAAVARAREPAGVSA